MHYSRENSIFQHGAFEHSSRRSRTAWFPALLQKSLAVTTARLRVVLISHSDGLRTGELQIVLEFHKASGELADKKESIHASVISGGSTVHTIF